MSAGVKRSEWARACTHELEGGGRGVSAGVKRSERTRTGTHTLEGGGRGLSAGVKRSRRGQALTFWRAEDAGCQQG